MKNRLPITEIHFMSTFVSSFRAMLKYILEGMFCIYILFFLFKAPFQMSSLWISENRLMYEFISYIANE